MTGGHGKTRERKAEEPAEEPAKDPIEPLKK
jgi:hypothetical protein